MITLTINAENPVDLMSQMAQLMVGATALKEIATAAPASPAKEPEAEPAGEDKPARKPRGKKTEEAPAAAEPAGEPSTKDDAQPAENTTSSSEADAGTASTEITEESLRARATRFAQKAGPSALVQLQTEAGAPDGKISQIIGDPERMQRMSDGLEALGY